MNESLLSQGSFEALNDKHLKITWDLISFCNFKCPYCLDMNTGRRIYNWTEDETRFAIDNILSLGFKSYEFVILGGEPTLYHRLLFIINELLSHQEIKLIYLMTNGSKKLNFSDDPRLMITCSIHPPFSDKMEIRDKYQRNIYFNLLGYPKMFKRVQELYNEFPVDEITVVRIPPTFENIFDYTQEQKEWILSHDPDNIKPNQPYHGTWEFKDKIINQPIYSMMEFNQKQYLDFEGMYCLNNSLIVQPDGYFKYTCYNSKLSTYSIYEKKIDYKPYLLQCKYHFCNCAGRLNILKIRDKEKAEECIQKVINR